MPEYLISIITKAAGIPAAEPKSIERLVRAKNGARAVAHIVADTMQVELATVDDIVRLTKAGIDVETAE